VKFRLLGPTEVVGDDLVAIEMPHLSTRESLTALLLMPGWRTRGEIAEALWADSPGWPDDAVRKRIQELRRAIGPGRVETRQRGEGRYLSDYRLRVESGELDCDSFQALSVAGRTALDDGDPAGAARLLQQAAELWRGSACPDLPATAGMQQFAAQLEENRKDAQDALVDARLGLGQHREVVASLRAGVRADRLREHRWSQLMLALYRCGEKSAALSVYGEVRMFIRAELGVDPSPELADLYHRIMDDDPALAYRTRSVASAAAAPMPSSWSPVCHLPPTPPDFTGRRLQLRELARQLVGDLDDGREDRGDDEDRDAGQPAPGRELQEQAAVSGAGRPGDGPRGAIARAGVIIIVVSGPPGSGKTTLAVRAAHLAAGHFPDGQLYVRLGGRAARRDPQDVLAEMLRGFGVPPAHVPAAAPEREGLYRSVLANRRVVLVADDAVDASQVRPLLPGTAGSAVLVTSGHRLPGLAGAHLVEVGDMAHDEAVTLLAAITGAAGRSADREALAGVAAACGYLPLALRIAGTRLTEPDLSPEDLTRALADGDHALDELDVGEDLSVRGALAPAYSSLGPPERHAFRLASLHPVAGGDLPGWMIPALATGPHEAADAGAIARAGLLTAVPGRGHAARRYRMHPVCRIYAADRRAAEDPPTAVITAAGRLTRCWLEIADHAGRQLPRHPCVPPAHAPAGERVIPADDCATITGGALAWFAAERRNLAAVTADACARGDHLLAAELADRQFTALCQLDACDDARQQWEQVAAAARRAGDGLAAARARYRVCVLHVCHNGNITPQARVPLGMTERDLTQCALEFDIARDTIALADAWYLLALCAMNLGNPGRARRYAEQGLGKAGLADDSRLRILHLSVLGTVLSGLGSAAEGLAHCDAAVTIAEDLGEPASRYLQTALSARDNARHLASQPTARWSPGWREAAGDS
jgi:DNA-binding SARP family transcriptional activator